MLPTFFVSLFATVTLFIYALTVAILEMSPHASPSPSPSSIYLYPSPSSIYLYPSPSYSISSFPSPSTLPSPSFSPTMTPSRSFSPSPTKTPSRSISPSTSGYPAFSPPVLLPSPNWSLHTQLKQKPIDVEFDSFCDIIVVAYDYSLEFFNSTNTDHLATVNLQKKPTCLSLWRGRVAVGHDAHVSIVPYTCQNFTAFLEAMISVPAIVNNIALGMDYKAMATVDGQWPGYYLVDIPTRQVSHHNSHSCWGRMLLNRHPNGINFYLSTTGLSPQQLYNLNIETGLEFGSPYWGTYSFGSNFWVTNDGRYIIAGSGNIFHSQPSNIIQPGTTQDMSYAGRLNHPIDWAYQISGLPWFYAVSRNGESISIVSLPFINEASTISTPTIDVYGVKKQIHLTALFSSDNNKLVGIGYDNGNTYYITANTFSYF